MNIFLILFMIISTLIAVSSTLYILIDMFWMIGYKLYRKIKFNASMYD